MYDKLGYPVQIGDPVLYVVGGQSDTFLYKGTVIDIRPSKRGPLHCLIRKENGRKLQLGRGTNEILSLKYLIPLDTVRETSPELFI